MRGLLAFAVASVAAAVFAFTARAVDPTVSPGAGGIGQSVVLTNFGFDAVKKPKVKLVPHAGETGLKPAGMKVSAFTTTEITAQVTGGRAGVYDVTVTEPGKGHTPATLADTFTIELPAPAATDPASGAAKAVVTITGARFGPSKGTVKFGGKKAKVKSWADDAITVVVPKAAAGAQPVVVTNKAGSSDGSLTFDVTASTSGGGGGGLGSGGVYVRADISGKGHFEVKVGGTPVGLNTVWTPANAQFTFGGTSKPTSGVPTFFISTLPLDLTLARPFHIGLSPNPPVNAIATMGYTDVGPAFTSYSAGFGLPGAALDLVITGWDGTYIEGTFTGTMIDLATGKPPLVVTNGQFRVKLQTGH